MPTWNYEYDGGVWFARIETVSIYTNGVCDEIGDQRTRKYKTQFRPNNVLRLSCRSVFLQNGVVLIASFPSRGVNYDRIFATAAVHYYVRVIERKL